jgi:hypothetical protein
MSFSVSAYTLEQLIEYDSRDHHAGLNELLVEALRQVDLEMRRKPAHMVYEMLRAHLARHLPGIQVDAEAIRDAAARIAVGLPVP